MSTTVLFALVALLGLNQLLSRIRRLHTNPTVFWIVQSINGGLGAGIIIAGLPGFEHVQPVSWVVGLLFFLHIGQNFRIRSDAETEARQQARIERDQRAQEIKSQLVDADTDH